MHRLDKSDKVKVFNPNMLNHDGFELPVEWELFYFRLLNRGLSNLKAQAIVNYHFIASNLLNYVFKIVWERKGPIDHESGRYRFHHIYVTSAPILLTDPDILKNHPITKHRYNAKSNSIHTYWIEPNGEGHHWFKLLLGGVAEIEGMWLAQDVLKASQDVKTL